MSTVPAPSIARGLHAALASGIVGVDGPATAEPSTAGSGARLARLWHHSSVTAGAFVPDGTHLLRRVGSAAHGFEAGWSWGVSDSIWIQAFLGLGRHAGVPPRTYGADTPVDWSGNGPTRSVDLRTGLQFGPVGASPFWLMLGVTEVKHRFEVTLTASLAERRQVDRQGSVAH